MYECQSRIIISVTWCMRHLLQNKIFQWNKNYKKRLFYFIISVMHLVSFFVMIWLSVCFLAFFFVLALIYYLIELHRDVTFLFERKKETEGENGYRKWIGNHSEIMISLISIGGWFFPTDWLLFSPECHRGGISMESLPLASNTFRQLHSRNPKYKHRGGLATINAPSYFLLSNHTIFAPFFFYKVQNCYTM